MLIMDFSKILNLEKNNNKKVLITLPTYNRSENIESILEQFRNQTHKNLKLIIINDGSSQEHKKKYDDLKKKYLNNNLFEFLENKQNLHIAKTLNKGIDYLLSSDEYDYFTWISDDNIYYENFIEKLIENNEYFNYSYYDIEDKINNNKTKNRRKYNNFNDILNNFGGCASFMWTKEAIKKIGKYRENINGCEDFDYILRTFKNNSIKCKLINIELMNYNKHEDALFIKENEKILKLKKIIENYKKLSIIVLCFNKLEYTRKCIDSILKNTLSDNYDLIIVNNGSTDDTYNYLNKIKNNTIKSYP